MRLKSLDHVSPHRTLVLLTNAQCPGVFVDKRSSCVVFKRYAFKKRLKKTDQLIKTNAFVHILQYLRGAAYGAEGEGSEAYGA